MAKVSLEHGFMLSSMQHLGGINQDLQVGVVVRASLGRRELEILELKKFDSFTSEKGVIGG